MSNDDGAKAAEAAIAVMHALQPLSAEEKSRVLNSAAALYGLSAPLPNSAPRQQGQIRNDESQREDAGNRGGTGKRMSIGELLQEKGAATNAQRVACFAYYREKFEGNANFSRSDLAAYFPQAKLPAPGANYAREYNKAVKQAWIHDDGAKSYLTGKGEAAVEAGFSGIPRKKAATSKKRKVGKTE